ncbi:unnamed protein product [Amoebophrya sp. A25]|nr:unnamed protein product [Amoebophrya sp. A25]|eukprot:GSA25T00011794001.1
MDAETSSDLTLLVGHPAIVALESDFQLAELATLLPDLAADLRSLSDTLRNPAAKILVAILHTLLVALSSENVDESRNGCFQQQDYCGTGDAASTSRNAGRSFSSSGDCVFLTPPRNKTCLNQRSGARHDELVPTIVNGKGHHQDYSVFVPRTGSTAASSTYFSNSPENEARREEEDGDRASEMQPVELDFDGDGKQKSTTRTSSTQRDGIRTRFVRDQHSDAVFTLRTLNARSTTASKIYGISPRHGREVLRLRETIDELATKLDVAEAAQAHAERQLRREQRKSESLSDSAMQFEDAQKQISRLQDQVTRTERSLREERAQRMLLATECEQKLWCVSGNPAAHDPVFDAAISSGSSSSGQSYSTRLRKQTLLEQALDIAHKRLGRCFEEEASLISCTVFRSWHAVQYEAQVTRELTRLQAAVADFHLRERDYREEMQQKLEGAVAEEKKTHEDAAASARETRRLRLQPCQVEGARVDIVTALPSAVGAIMEDILKRVDQEIEETSSNKMDLPAALLVGEEMTDEAVVLLDNQIKVDQDVKFENDDLVSVTTTDSEEVWDEFPVDEAQRADQEDADASSTHTTGTSIEQQSELEDDGDYRESAKSMPSIRLLDEQWRLAVREVLDKEVGTGANRCGDTFLAVFTGLVMVVAVNAGLNLLVSPL